MYVGVSHKSNQIKKTTTKIIEKEINKNKEKEIQKSINNKWEKDDKLKDWKAMETRGKEGNEIRLNGNGKLQNFSNFSTQ